MNIWLLTNTPSSYQCEFFEAIHSSGRMDLDVRFMRLVHRGEVSLAEDALSFSYTALKRMAPLSWPDEYTFHPGALREVWQSKHDFYVLSGLYTSTTFLLCAFLLCLRRKKWALWLEQPWPSDYRPKWATRWSVKVPILGGLRRRILRCLLARASTVFCIGTAAARAYGALGMPKDKACLLPYHCDVSRFTQVPYDEIHQCEEQYDLEGKTVFLYSGQLIMRKGVDTLLAAFEKVASECGDVALLLLGDGPERKCLESSLSAHTGDCVHFLGHVEQEGIPALFGAADVFVFPSRHDGWGVVVNEACGAGMPLIVSRSTGASEDLVRDGENGFLFERDDVDALAEHMRFFVEHPEKVGEFGSKSINIIEQFSLPEGVTSLERYVREEVDVR